MSIKEETEIRKEIRENLNEPNLRLFKEALDAWRSYFHKVSSGFIDIEPNIAYKAHLWCDEFIKYLEELEKE